MTVIGASLYAGHTTPLVITSPPTSSWTQLARLPGTNLPDQGASQDYVFVVSCQLGQFAGTQGANHARVQLGLGPSSGGAPETNTWRWQHLTWPRFQQANENEAMPLYWVYHRNSIDGGPWNTADDLVLWGRIDLNGDTEGQVSGASALVSTIIVHAFSLKNLGANDYTQEVVVPASPQTLTAAPSFRDLALSVTGWGQGTGDWVVFTATQYISRGVGLAGSGIPLLQTTYSADGTPGAQVPLFGDPEAGPTVGQFGRMGMGARTGRVNGSGRYCNYSHGGATLLQNPASIGKIGVRGYDYGSASTAFVRWEMFAIRCDASAPGGGLGVFEYVRIPTTVAGPPVGADQIYHVSTAAGLPKLETFELSPTISPTLQQHFYFNACPEAEAISQAKLTARLRVFHPGGSQLLAQERFDNSFERFEGVHGHAGRDITGLPGAYKILLYGLGRSGVTISPTHLYPHDFFAMAWNWDNQFQVASPGGSVPFGPPAIPAPVAIVPGRESLDPSSLNALPNGAGGRQLLPDAAMEVVPHTERHELDAHDGTHYTWPRFLGPRREWDVRWSFDRADRDTLLAFLLAQGKRQFQWQPPEDQSAIAVIMLGSPTSEHLGAGLYNVSAKLIELVWTGV